MIKQTSESFSKQTSEKQKTKKNRCDKDFWCNFIVGTKIAIIIALSAFLAMKYLEHKCQEYKKQTINNEKTK